MKNKFLNFILIWSLLMSIFSLFTIYKDIKVNKLLNYLSEPKGLTASATQEKREHLTKILNFNFKAVDNNLGVINAKIGKLNDREGELNFSLTDLDSGDLIYQNKFNFNYFEGGGFFPFGFPNIPNSKSRHYQRINRSN